MGGSYIFPKILWHAYNIMYGFGIPIEFVLDGKLAAISVATYLLCALGATYLVCRGFLREVPAELIRPKAPKEGKRVLLERITFLWKRLGFLTKVSLRNVLRYKQRFFMMVLGIGGCTALLLTGFGIKDSIANVVDYQFEEITLVRCGGVLHRGDGCADAAGVFPAGRRCVGGGVPPRRLRDGGGRRGPRR